MLNLIDIADLPAFRLLFYPLIILWVVAMTLGLVIVIAKGLKNEHIAPEIQYFKMMFNPPLKPMPPRVEIGLLYIPVVFQRFLMLVGCVTIVKSFQLWILGKQSVFQALLIYMMILIAIGIFRHMNSTALQRVKELRPTL